MLNQARLKVLKVREDHVRNVLDEARKRLGEVTRDQGRYSQVLKSLVIQSLYQVIDNESKFFVNSIGSFLSSVFTHSIFFITVDGIPHHCASSSS